jgi:hypothetical protein
MADDRIGSGSNDDESDVDAVALHIALCRSRLDQAAAAEVAHGATRRPPSPVLPCLIKYFYRMFRVLYD